MPSAATIRKQLEETKSDQGGVRNDVPTFEKRVEKAEKAVVDATRGGAPEKERAAAVEALTKARHMLDGQHATRQALEKEAAQLARDLEEQEHAEAVDVATKRLGEAEAGMRERGERFLELVEAPMRDLAEAWLEVRQATQAARALGVKVRGNDRVHVYLKAEETHTGRDDWWTAAAAHVAHLAQNMARGLTEEDREERRAKAEAQRERTSREGKKRQLARLRVNTPQPGDKERRDRLEAEVGAELDAEAAA
jgi:hypothetical protein